MILRLAKLAVFIETVCIIILFILIATPKQVFTSRIEIRLVERIE